MKRIQWKALTFPALLLVFCSALYSFSPFAGGGDRIMIYLNDKLVLRQDLHDIKKVPGLQLLQTSATDKVDVYYSHCGHNGKDRYITIRNDQNQPLKVYQYPDAPGGNGAMSFKLNDVAGLGNAGNGKNLQLYYSSRELPGGRLLATMTVENSSLASR